MKRKKEKQSVFIDTFVSPFKIKGETVVIKHSRYYGKDVKVVIEIGGRKVTCYPIAQRENEYICVESPRESVS